MMKRDNDDHHRVLKEDLIDLNQEEVLERMYGKKDLPWPTAPNADEYPLHFRDSLRGSREMEAPNANESLTREDIENNPNHRIHYGRIHHLHNDSMCRKEMMENGAKSLPAVQNYLDIPISSAAVGLAVDGLEFSPDLIDYNPRDYDFRTRLPRELATWGLAASAGALSPTHVDESGFDTYLQIVFGCKLWLFGFPRTENPKEWIRDARVEAEFSEKLETRAAEINESDRPLSLDTMMSDLASQRIKRKNDEEHGQDAFLSGIFGVLDERLDWRAVYLKAGDELYVPFQ